MPVKKRPDETENEKDNGEQERPMSQVPPESRPTVGTFSEGGTRGHPVTAPENIPTHKVKGETQAAEHIVPEGEWPLPQREREAHARKQAAEAAQQRVKTLREQGASEEEIKAAEKNAEATKAAAEESEKSSKAKAEGSSKEK